MRQPIHESIPNKLVVFQLEFIAFPYCLFSQEFQSLSIISFRFIRDVFNFIVLLFVVINPATFVFDANALFEGSLLDGSGFTGHGRFIA